MEYKNSLRQILFPIIIAVVLLSGFYLGSVWQAGFSQGSPGNRLMIYPQSNKIEALLNLIEQDYVDSVDKKDLVERIIPDIIKHLDPHTIYIPADELLSANQELEGNFGGIGVQFSLQNDTVLVINVVKGGPSEKVGIMPGDRIVTVNDSLIAGVKIINDSVMGMLRGEMGTKVRVGIKRHNLKSLLNFEITRGNIPVFSVETAYMLTDSIGYIKVSRFGRNTYQEFLTSLARLKAHNCKNLMVDLRGNSGGYLDIAISMCNEFLDKGDLIVYTEGHSNPRQNVYANGSGSCKDMAITVLTDEGSASASEIFAGAIQDNDRGLVVGRRSFGKGLVQQQMMLPDGSAVRLTVSRYYTPSGRCIQKSYENGVEDYQQDIVSRFTHGEFFEKDSIVMNDSLKYLTKGGRTVYGGGGVMPDIFVPRDTTDLTDYYMSLRGNGIIYQFALKYSDDNRPKLQQFENAVALKEYLDTQPVTQQMLKFSDQRGIKHNKTQYQLSQNLIDLEVKAYIARNILDNEGFYPIIHQMDETVISAVKAIQAGSTVLDLKQ
jgi:carboxyl-terminal processing protease